MVRLICQPYLSIKWVEWACPMCRLSECVALHVFQSVNDCTVVHICQPGGTGIVCTPLSFLQCVWLGKITLVHCGRQEAASSARMRQQLSGPTGVAPCSKCWD